MASVLFLNFKAITQLESLIGVFRKTGFDKLWVGNPTLGMRIFQPNVTPLEDTSTKLKLESN